jgi:hypothetical protein
MPIVLPAKQGILGDLGALLSSLGGIPKQMQDEQLKRELNKLLITALSSPDTIDQQVTRVGTVPQEEVQTYTDPTINIDDRSNPQLQGGAGSFLTGHEPTYYNETVQVPNKARQDAIARLTQIGPLFGLRQPGLTQEEEVKQAEKLSKGKAKGELSAKEESPLVKRELDIKELEAKSKTEYRTAQAEKLISDINNSIAMIKVLHEKNAAIFDRNDAQRERNIMIEQARGRTVAAKAIADQDNEIAKLRKDSEITEAKITNIIKDAKTGAISKNQATNLLGPLIQSHDAKSRRLVTLGQTGIMTFEDSLKGSFFDFFRSPGVNKIPVTGITPNAPLKSPLEMFPEIN